MALLYRSTKYFLLLLVLLAFSTTVFPQAPASTPRDYIGNRMFWGNMLILGKIKGKFSYQVDLECRRQADPAHPANPNTTVGSSHYNIFKHPYQNAVRPWIHYQPNKNIRLSVSPITWFGTWTYPVDGQTTFQPELRTSVQLTVNNYLGRVILNNRYRYEFRFFGKKEVTDNTSNPIGPSSTFDFQDATGRQGRFRYMLRAIIPINTPTIEKGTYYLMTSSEIFLRAGKYISNANIIDQNRFYLGMGWKFAPEIRIEAGYFNQTAFRLNNIAKNNVDFNNALFVNLLFDNFNSLFKKKKKEVHD